MKRECLILLTDEFPFGHGETYIATEIEYLAKKFNQVIILSASHHPASIANPLPGNVDVISYTVSSNFIDKIISIRFFLSPLFWQEIFMIVNKYQSRVSWKHLKIMLAALHNASGVKKKIRELIKKTNVNDETLLVYSYWMDSKAIGAAWIAKEKKLAVISRAHNWDIYFERQEPAYLPFRKFIAAYLLKIYFISDHGRNYFHQRMAGTDQPKSAVSRLGTTYKGRNPQQSSKAFVICSCAWMAPVKRIELIVPILASIKDFPVQWIHFGDGPLMPSIRALVDTMLSERDNISIEFKGRTKNSVILDYYLNHHIDLFILTSSFEGIPVSIMEAMAAGIPVMAADAGGVSEIVTDKNGFLLPHNFDPYMAAEKIKNYFVLPAGDKQGYRENAFNTWKEKYNAEVNYRDFVEEISSL